MGEATAAQILRTARRYRQLTVAESSLVHWRADRLRSSSVLPCSRLSCALMQTVGAAFYLLFTALFGYMLGSILLAYQIADIMAAFIATAGMFGVMSFLGYTTKIDLSRFGSIFMMALIGLLIASLVNLFLRSRLSLGSSPSTAVLIFAGLTAYDTQWINEQRSPDRCDRRPDRRATHRLDRRFPPVPRFRQPVPVLAAHLRQQPRLSASNQILGRKFPASFAERAHMDDPHQCAQSRFSALAEQYIHSQVHRSGYLTGAFDRAPAAFIRRLSGLDVATGGGHVALKLAQNGAKPLASDLTLACSKAARQFASARRCYQLCAARSQSFAIPRRELAGDHRLAIRRIISRRARAS